MQLGCAWNRNDPRLLGKQPSKRELSRCHLPLFREFAEQINQRLVSFTVLRVKAWDGVAEIRLSNFVFSLILPVRKPLPTTLNRRDREFDRELWILSKKLRGIYFQLEDFALFCCAL
jgi:hypothetical protein